MNSAAKVLDFIHGLTATNSVDEVCHSFQRLIEQFGFTQYSIGSLKPYRDGRGAMWSTTLRKDWLSHWMNMGYIHVDPVIWELKRRRDPFRWSSIKSRGDVPRRELFDEAAQFGIRDGWGFSFHFTDPDAPLIAFSACTDRYELHADDEAPLNLATVYCGLKLARLGYPQTALARQLSNRECECLNWTATGRTDWEISEILGISEQTVHKHIANALRKLKAGTRAQAVAIALTMNQIAL